MFSFGYIQVLPDHSNTYKTLKNEKVSAPLTAVPQYWRFPFGRTENPGSVPIRVLFKARCVNLLLKSGSVTRIVHFYAKCVNLFNNTKIISTHYLNSSALTKCLVIAMVAYRSIYLVKSKSFTRGDNNARKSQKNFHG